MNGKCIGCIIQDLGAVVPGRMGAVASFAFIFLIGFGLASVQADMELTLSEAIKLAGEHSRSIRAAEHDSSSAAYRYKEACAARFPTISLEAKSFYKDELQSISIPPRSIEIGSHENYQLDVRLTQPIFTGGRITNRVKLRKKQFETQRLSLESERLRVAYACRKAYFELEAALSLEKSAEASLRRLRIIENNVQDLFSSGMADSIDLLDAGAAVQDALQRLEKRRTQTYNASAVLARLIGVSPKELLLPSDHLPDPSMPALEEEDIKPGRIKRPEIAMLESRIRSADLMVSLSKADFLPTLSGFGSYSLGKPNQDLFNKQWNDYFAVGISLSWEFNTGGQAARSVSAALQTAYSAGEAKKDLEEELLLQARMALRNLKYAYETFEITRRKYEIARRRFKLAREKQAAGNMSVNRLLELETELSSVEHMFTASKSDYYIARTELLYATGSKEIFGGL